MLGPSAAATAEASGAGSVPALVAVAAWKFCTVSIGLPDASRPPKNSAPPVPNGTAAIRDAGVASDPSGETVMVRVLIGLRTPVVPVAPSVAVCVGGVLLRPNGRCTCSDARTTAATAATDARNAATPSSRRRIRSGRGVRRASRSLVRWISGSVSLMPRAAVAARQTQGGLSDPFGKGSNDDQAAGQKRLGFFATAHYPLPDRIMRACGCQTVR